MGDKTLVDALEPAVNAANTVDGPVTRDIEELLHRMELAADEGATATATMVARIGRSSYLGERSRGLVDPGAMFICLFLKGMRESLGRLRHNVQE